MARRAVTRWFDIRASLQASILKHDTPVANFDDRDESNFDARLSAVFILHKTLEADLRLYAVEHHTVYLHRSRSGENHTRRSLRLLPGMRWRPGKKTDLRFHTEVRAVYTTDDFEFPDQPKNDQSAREMRYSGTLSQQLGSNAELLIDGSYSYLVLGRLLWQDFAEIPFDTLSTTSGWIRLAMGSRWRAELGVRAFYRSEYERSLTVRYVPAGLEGIIETVTRPGRERLIQIGPTGTLTVPLSDGSEVRFAGWVQFQQVRLTLYGDLPPDNEEAIKRAVSEAEIRTIPNLAISLLWNL